MIPTTAANTAIAIASQLDAQDRLARPAPGTLLEELTNTCCVMVKPNAFGDEQQYTPDPELIEAESRAIGAESETLSQHDVLMSEAVLAHAPLVADHLNFAKNTVRPIIATFVETAAQLLASQPDVATFSPTVRIVDVPAAILATSLKEEILRFDKPAIPFPAAGLNLPAKSPQEILALMQTGSAVIDQEIALWTANIGEAFFVSVYQNVFGDGRSERITGCDDYGQYNTHTAVFLMARRLLDEVPSGAPYTLNEYIQRVGTLVEQSAMRLGAALKERELAVSQEKLIMSWNGKDCVTVFKPVYEYWMENDGNAAVLFGNLLLPQINYFLPGIMQDRDRCLQFWEAQNRVLTTTLRNNKYVTAQGTLRYVADKALNDNAAVICGCETIDTNKINELREAARVFISCLDETEIVDLWSVGLNVVAGIYFAHTAALKILDAGQRIAKENPDISPAECELLAVADYVCEYVADMIEVG